MGDSSAWPGVKNKLTSLCFGGSADWGSGPRIQKSLRKIRPKKEKKKCFADFDEKPRFSTKKKFFADFDENPRFSKKKKLPVSVKI